MNNRVIQQVLEYQATDKVALELDRLLLRIHEIPALESYLNAVGKSGEKTELDFLDLPIQAVEAVKKLIGPTEIEVLSYEINGRQHVGFRFDLKPLAELNTEEPESVVQ